MATAADPEPDPRRWLALLTCCSALFMTLLDVSVTNVALPSIGRSTAATPSQLQWVVSGYTLAFGLVPVLAGRLGDDHGRRLMFQIGVAGFVATSMLAGLSPTAGILIGARVLQGLAGGLINPQVSGLIQQLFRGDERGRAFGILGTTVGVGTALGPVVGGGLIGLGGPHNGWRLVFFINVPVGIAAILLSRRLLPRDGASGRHRLDLVGALLLGSATFCILFMAVEYDAIRDRRLGALVVPALVLVALFARRESRLTRERRDPLVDLRLFRVPSYSSGVVLALAYFPAMAGLPLVLALYYQRGLGYSALQSGLGITAYALGSGIAAPLAGRVVTRIGRPLVVAATITFGVGAAVLALLAIHAPTAAALVFAPALFVMGAGSGAVITPNQALSLMEVDPATGSTAGGVLQTAQRIGLAIGQAVIGAVFFAALGTGRGVAAYGHALRMAILTALVFVGLAAVVGVSDLMRSRRRATTSAG
ncbi:MAG TPA: MFS transporter [Jatrophihabitans sp.]|jgi:EmrB/QacA subfamily drug resistance transporter|uniref:MFS transporter n=1 Tax=Jatrophihabitans sp. TaxID=1932789 RepID=UPI002E01FA3E|nr:MFS transporter [Jatrophihabitans sp.]